MDINQQKEKFSDAYLQAVASVAGYSLTVSLPINNQFSVEQLHSIMQLLSQGDKL